MSRDLAVARKESRVCRGRVAKLSPGLRAGGAGVEVPVMLSWAGAPLAPGFDMSYRGCPVPLSTNVCRSCCGHACGLRQLYFWPFQF